MLPCQIYQASQIMIQVHQEANMFFEWQTFHLEASSGDPYWMLCDLDHRGTKRLAEVCWVACLTHLCSAEILGWVPLKMSKGLYRMYYNAWVSDGFSDLCSSEGNVYGRSELLFSKHPVEERSKSIYIYIHIFHVNSFWHPCHSDPFMDSHEIIQASINPSGIPRHHRPWPELIVGIFTNPIKKCRFDFWQLGLLWFCWPT